MKRLHLIIILSIIASSALAGGHLKCDTVKRKDTTNKVHLPDTFVAVEMEPQFPGGIPAFSSFILKNLRYPEIANLVGLSGKVYVTFVVDKDGAVTEARPVKCIGAGCESEAVRVISMSPNWKPGVQKGRAVRVQYSVPISFNATREKVYLKDLKKSAYGFVFAINGKYYTLDEALEKIGKSYLTTQLEEADPFYNADNNPKFTMPDKKEVYLLKIKS